MANKNGLCAPEAYAAPNNPYYASSQLRSPTIVSPTLVSTITLQSGGAEGTLAVPADIVVPGPTHATPAYVGAVRISPGGNEDAPNGAAGVVIRAGEGVNPGEACTIMEIGTNGESPNQLYIAGSQGLSEVYDELYNQPVALRDVVLSNVSPTNIVDTANPGEIFRCAQAGVAASALAAIGATVEVPRSGWYMVAIEVKMTNAPAPAPPSIELAIGAAGPFNVGSSLTFAMTDGVVANPYGVLDVNTMDFAVSQIADVNDGPVRQYSFMQLLEAETEYTFTLRSSNAAINIGVGQIKAELIAMC